MVLRQGGDPALGETFRSPSKFTRGLNPTPSFSPEAETLALPWWSRSQGTRSHATPRRVRCYPVSARYSRVAGLCLPMRAGAHTPWRHRGFGSRSICFAPPRQTSRPDRGLHTFCRRHLASREEEFRAVLPPLRFERRRGDPREPLGPQPVIVALNHVS